MKLKTLLLLKNESAGYGTHGSALGGSLTSQDTKLRPWAGSMDDVESWDGVTEGKGWFAYRESNNWDTKRSGASIHITEGEPHKYWIRIKTHGLRKPTDTHESYRQRVTQHSDKVSRAWQSAAKKLHGNPEINEVGNELQMTWKEAFKLALEDAKVKPFIAEWGEGQTKPAQTKATPVIADPVNFTLRLQENTEQPAPIIYFIKYWKTDETGVEEEVVQDFSDKKEANKLVDSLAKKKAAYDLYVKILGDHKIYDSKDQKGHELIGFSYATGIPSERFRDDPLTENMNPQISYSAVVLDEESRAKLLTTLSNQIPDGWEKICHHMTIKMGELPPDKKSDLGKFVNLTATEVGISEKAFAVKVSGYFTTNKISHITVAIDRKNGAKPFDSNGITNWEKLSHTVSLTGTVSEIPKN